MRKAVTKRRIAGGEDLSHSQLTQFQKWLDEKGVLAICELCEDEAEVWRLNSRLMSLVAVASIETGRVQHCPLLTLHCENCGNVRMFDPYVIFKGWRRGR
jgi:hypothetical protein